MVQFASYLRRVLCKTRLIFRRINGPTVFIFASNNDALRSFFLNTKGLGKGAKKQVVTDEWRNGNIEERLEYALVKVTPPLFIIYHCIDNFPFCNLRSLVIKHL